MQHALAVGEGDGVADFAENRQQAVERVVAEGFGHLFAQIGEDGVERAAFDPLHRIEQRLAVLPHDVVDGHDVGMRQLGQYLGLAQKTLPHAGVRVRLQQHDLDGHGAVELGIMCLQHTAHATGGDLRAELVVLHAERRWRWGWGVGGHGVLGYRPGFWCGVSGEVTSPAHLAARPARRGSLPVRARCGRLRL